MGSASAFSIIHSCDLPGHQFYRALPCGLIINMMLCYDISLWQVMSMMDGTERLKENHTHTHTHTATLLPICRQQLHDGGLQVVILCVSSFIASSCAEFTQESPQQGRIRFVGQLQGSVGQAQLQRWKAAPWHLKPMVGQARWGKWWRNCWTSREEYRFEIKMI